MSNLILNLDWLAAGFLLISRTTDILYKVLKTKGLYEPNDIVPVDVRLI
jgi:hypothetical protein